MEILQRGFNDAFKLYLEWNKFNMGEHRGTHTDAPSHFVQGHWRNHEVPSSHLVGPGVLVDVRAKVRDNPVYKMTVEDLKAWEKENGRIPNGAVVLMSSGWGKRYPDPKQVFNTNNVTDTASYKYPSIHAAAAEFLAHERNVTAVGVDVPSPDCGDPAMPTHVTLLTKDILILENVANVDKLPPSGTTIVIGMIKINDGSGGPSRILALNGL
nr:hypothetical protein BaRGS_033149 [Batillaria attramentaria]